MANDLAALDAKLGRLVDSLDGTSLTALTKSVALAAKNDALDALDADLPARKFTHWRPKLGVGFEVTSEATAEVKPRPSGPWRVLDQGRTRGSKFVRKRRRVIGWGPTKGHDTWATAGHVIEQKTPERVDEGVQHIIRKAFS